MRALVLDSQGLSLLAREHRGAAFERAQAYLIAALESGSPVVVPTVVLVEQYRGRPQDAAIDLFLSRHRKALVTVDLDQKLARACGRMLADHGLGSESLADAAVVAAAARYGSAIILTSDFDDIDLLASGFSLIDVVRL